MANSILKPRSLTSCAMIISSDFLSLSGTGLHHTGLTFITKAPTWETSTYCIPTLRESYFHTKRSPS